MKTPSSVSWFGGKSQLADRIVSHFPEHHTYVEPFGGSAAVLLAKAPAKIEVYNEVNQERANLFQVLRDTALFRRLKEVCDDTTPSRAELALALEPSTDPVEAARRFMVRQRQSAGGRGRPRSENTVAPGGRRWLPGIDRLPAIHRRLSHVHIELDHWEQVVKRYDTPQTLFYLAPLCPDHHRSGDDPHELTQDDHHRLADTLLNLQGMAVLSGFQCEAFEQLEEAGWQRIPADGPSVRRRRRQECLWLSPLAGGTPIQRMRQGAYLTHRLRTDATEERVIDAIAELRREGQRITFTAVARSVEISREHLSRRYQHLFFASA